MAHNAPSKEQLSRADQIRQRRRQREMMLQQAPVIKDPDRNTENLKRRISPTSVPQNYHRVSAIPVILTRRNNARTSNSRRNKNRHNEPSRSILANASTRVRRKLFIPLHTPGAEINLPSLPIVKLGWRLASGTIAFTCLVILIIYSTTDIFKVGDIKVDGLTRVNPGDIEAVLDLRGTPIYKVLPKDVRDKLVKDFPELVDISIAVTIPNGVMIRAAERTPMVTWLNNDQVWFIDAEGVVFPSRGFTTEGTLVIKSSEAPPAPAPKPVIKGFSIPWYLNLFSSDKAVASQDNSSSESTANGSIPGMELSHYADLDLIHAAQALSCQVPEGTVLIYSSRDGLGWYDNRGWNVYIGVDLENMEIKLAEYTATVTQLEEKGIQPIMISVEHIHAPFYRVD